MRREAMLVAALAFAIAGGAYGSVCAQAGQSQSQPAGIGTGPACQLQCLTGCEFETAYVELMCQQEADVADIAALGQRRISNRALLDFSNKMQKERMDLRSRLAALHSDAACCSTALCGSDRVQCLRDQLACCSGSDFEKPYVLTLIALLRQSKEAADLAMSRAPSPGIRALARSASDINANEIGALKMWLRTGYLTHDALSRNCGWDGIPGACSYP